MRSAMAWAAGPVAPRPVRRAVRRMAAPVAAVLVLAACSAGDDRPSRPAPTASSPETTTASTVPDTGPVEGDGVAAVVAAGDIACSPNDNRNGRADACQHGATADLVQQIDPAAVLLLGDLQYPGGAYEHFRASYHPTWGRFFDRSHPAPGNHEYAGGVANGYYRYWGDRAGPDRRGWYSVRVGSWKVIALNSNCGLVGCDAGSEQERWLRNELAADPAPCTLAFWHHPRHSSGLHGSSSSVEPLWAALAEGGADVVLGGHDHHYERFAPERGVRSFVVGTGGHSLYPVVRATPGSERHSARHYGVLELRLGDGVYSWEFHAAGGEPFTDEGRDRCR